MNKALVAVLGFVIVIGLGILGISSMYTGAHDTAVDFESNIETLYKASETDLSTYTLTIKEKTQISDMYVSDLRSVIGEYFNGKQGVTEKQVMSFIQQHIPNLDSKIYQELLATIEGGRKQFSNTQKKKLDQCGAYNKFRKGFWNSRILDSGVFPGKDVEHWCTVVSDQQTRTAMQTGIQEPLKLK
jgi:bacterioferritin-associated ferredoxin